MCIVSQFIDHFQCLDVGRSRWCVRTYIAVGDMERYAVLSQMFGDIFIQLWQVNLLSVEWTVCCFFQCLLIL